MPALMKGSPSGSPQARASKTTGAPSVRPIASGDGWSVSEFLCSAGPLDRPFEERHDGYSIAAVMEGCFTYRTGRQASLLYPGALLLGNSRSRFACGHDHSIGDRCISFNFREDVFDEIASASRAKGFRRPMLPASHGLTPLFCAIEDLRRGAPSRRAEELAVEVAEAALGALDGAAPRLPRLTGKSGGSSRRCAGSRRILMKPRTFPGLRASRD